MLSTDTVDSSDALFNLLNKVKLKEVERVLNRSWIDWILYQWKEGFLFPLLVWILWMLVGTIYFGSVDFERNYCKGFYYSVNVGYSVGWGVLKLKYRYSKIFAGFYLFLGALFVLQYVAYLITLAISESDNAYEQYKIKRNIEKTNQFTGWVGSVYVFVAMNNEKLFLIYVWVLLLFCGAFVTVCTVHWSWLDGFYYALTSMSTAGLEGIPRDSPDYLFVATGLLAAVGVPVMAMAVGNIGLLMAEGNSLARVESVVNQKQSDTRKELVDLLLLKEQYCTSSTIGVDMTISRGEFLLASLVRMRVCDIELIHDLLNKFDGIDPSHTGSVAMAHLKSERCPGSPHASKCFENITQDSGRISNSSNAVSKAGYLYLDDA